MKFRQSIILLTSLSLLGACTGEGTAQQDDAARSTVSVMTFNVENLFDNVDDPDKDDKAYLPIAAKQTAEHVASCNAIEVKSWRDECLLLDWSGATVEHKLSAVADTIRQFDGGRGADIIAFQEVENAAILNRLREQYLQGLGYGPAILIEGTDARGIDVAFLSRLPVVGEPILHPGPFDDFPDRMGDTRGVLQADFRLPDGSLLTGFAVHFPAPYHPPEMRDVAYRQLNALRDALPDDHHVFAAGDFNTTSEEMAERDTLEQIVRPVWQVAHDLCEGCRGTYYYAPDDNWSFLDIILFSPARSEKTTARIRAGSVQILNRTPAQVSDSGTPEPFRAATGTGVSDHWPLAAIFEITKKQ